MSKLKKWLCLVLLCAAACTGCTGVSGAASPQPDEDMPVLSVSLIQGTSEYEVVARLQDAAFKAELEQALGAKLEISTIPPLQDVTRTTEISFTDVLLLDDPKWIVPLAAGRKLAVLDRNPDESYSVLGKYAGRQYGYVFEEYTSAYSGAVVAVLPEVLENAGIREIPFTADALLQALETLSEVDILVQLDASSIELGSTPLAVYGYPNEVGFWPLLALFDLVPEGGEEFCLEDGKIVYDKITLQGKEYLAFLQQLYNQKLIGGECLLQSGYSALDLLIQGKCAIAVLPSEELAREAVEQSALRGNRIALARLPVGDEFRNDRAYKRLTGVVAEGCEHPQLALRFLELLHQLSAQKQAPEPCDFEYYPLFDLTGEPARRLRVDMVEQVFPDVRRPYENAVLNTASGLDSFYYRIMAGDLPLDAFDTMCREWLREDLIDNPNDTLAGASLLELYNRWYHNP